MRKISSQKFINTSLKILPFAIYIIRAISYGVLFAVAALLVFPQLGQNNNLNALLSLNTSEVQPPLSFAKAVSLASPAVVNIYSQEIQVEPKYGKKGRLATRLGSGVIMTSEGYILTNFHVIQNADLISVWLQNGQRYPAQLIGVDLYTDLAVLKVNAGKLPVILQKATQKSLAGDIVLAIGNPLNLGQTVTQGIISATGRNGLSTTNYLEFLQMDAAINEGNSGGALVNSNGVLVGINSRKFTHENSKLNIQGIFFAVPYQLADKVMQQIITNGRVVRGWLGISATRYLPDIKGFIIEFVTPNSPAQLAGLLAGDVIYQINNQAIQNITQALDIVAETPPNTKVNFKYYRESKAFDTTVTIVELVK